MSLECLDEISKLLRCQVFFKKRILITRFKGYFMHYWNFFFSLNVWRKCLALGRDVKDLRFYLACKPAS